MPTPNFIVFLTDQQRWDTTGVSGNPLDLTPYFDRVANRGAYLANCFTCQPVCGPARSCLQTGLFATQTGCWSNGIPLAPDYPDTLAKCFRRGGYETAYIGKWHLAHTETAPVPPAMRGGYEHWLASDTLELTSDAYDVTMFDADEQPVHLPGYRVDALTDAAIRYIDGAQHREKPFFLFMSFLEPHHQNSRDDYPAPDGYAERYGGGWMPPDLAALPSLVEGDPDCAERCMPGYLGMIKRLDDALGRLLNTLKSLNLSDETVVLVTSDHGNHFKTRNNEYKRSCHESSIRVPGAICGPGFDGAGRIDNLVSTVDVVPTLLHSAGLPVPPQVRGTSLLTLVEDKQAEWPDDVFVQISESQIGRAVRTHRWKYGVNAADSQPRGRGYAEIYQTQYLYDLEADPYELNNLAGDASYSDVVADLRQRLMRRMAEAGEPVAELL